VPSVSIRCPHPDSSYIERRCTFGASCLRPGLLYKPLYFLLDTAKSRAEEEML
jgi:hypothetical protein